MRAAVAIARRELRAGFARGFRGFRILLACLALGVGAIAAVGLVRAAIDAGFRDEGARLLGGDAELRFSYRLATPEERAWMDRVAERVSEVVVFRSMATVPDAQGPRRALTEVKAVDDAYPLVGEVVLEPPQPLGQALAGQGGLPGVVMAPVLADRLGLEVGDRVRFGSTGFVFAGRLLSEPDRAGGGFLLGPRSLVRRADLAGSGLLAPGTMFDSRYRLDLPADADLDRIGAEARALFRDSGGRWRDARDAAPGLRIFAERLGNFLILVGLAGLVVGGVGVAAAVSAHLSAKVGVIATLRTLGATRGTLLAVVLIEVGALALAGIFAGLVLGLGVTLAAAPALSGLLPVPARFAAYPGPLIEAALYGFLAALLFALWPLSRVEDVRPAALFRGMGDGARARPWPRWPYLIASGLLAFALPATAAALTGAERLTAWTFGALAGALVVLALVAALLRRLARAWAPAMRGRPALRWALAAIGGTREQTGAVILALGLGLAVLSAVGQIDANLRGAIARELPKVAPSFFFVDIQKDQIDRFLARLRADPAVTRVDHAPMLRGVITRINGRPAEEVAGPHWVLRGDRGVTYSARPPEGTRLTAGQWWPEDYSGPPQLSFAAEEGAEMGLRLGDRLTVNILGRDIEAEITSFREVDFSTAGIGFVMAMNPGALAGAPHSFIATTYAAPEAEARILRALAEEFPNVTAVPVREVIGEASRLLSAIASGISWGAGVTLATGFLVLLGAALASLPARIEEAAILRALGATRGRILLSFALRSALLGAAAGVIALAAGAAAAWAVLHFVMEADFALAGGPALAIVAGGAAGALLANLGFAAVPLSRRPASVLRAID